MSDEKYGFYQVSFKRFKSSNPDGTGMLLILEDKTVRVPDSDSSKKGDIVKKLYREVKKEIKGM